MLTFSLASCIQDEALNQEAAIDGCTGIHIQQATINAENHTIQLYVSGGVNLQRVEIHFDLPEGATVAPLTNSKGDEAPYYNFSEKQTRQFKVVSEDQAHSAVYQVSLWQTQLPTKYHFELLSSEVPFHVFYEVQDGKRLEWASGNPGFKLTHMASTETGYPTVQMKDGGSDGGKYVKLETKDTGSFGAMASMYIAAGNLFIGSFDVMSALTNPLAATQFGFPFYEEPVSLEGYYKFQRGAVYEENNTPVPGKQDECDIYGVLYEVDEEMNSLDGGNSLTSDHIVLMARFQAEKGNPEISYEPEGRGDYLPEKEEWTKFKFPFVPRNGKTVDAEKLKNGGYKLAIVFSSSVNGAYFKGAIGSTLCVDEVTLTVK